MFSVVLTVRLAPGLFNSLYDAMIPATKGSGNSCRPAPPILSAYWCVNDAFSWGSGRARGGTKGRYMDFAGRYGVAAGRQAVWEALNDAAILGACIPGCQRIEWVGEDALVAEIGVNLGIVRPVFTGDLTLSNVDPARSYTLTGSGRGGVFGHAQAAADITLEDDAGGTLLAFHAHGGASGRLMKLGRSLIGNSAQRVIDGFFIRFGEAMGASVTPLPLAQDA